jgi:hypothetical protein
MPDQLDGCYSYPVFKNLYILHQCDTALSTFTRSIMLGYRAPPEFASGIWIKVIWVKAEVNSGGQNMRHLGLIYVGESRSLDSDEGVQI